MCEAQMSKSEQDVMNGNKYTKQAILEVIEEWQSIWMDQRQNSEADFKNYFSRALGVDANMSHSLAKMMAKHFNAALALKQGERTKSQIELDELLKSSNVALENFRLREALKFYADKNNYDFALKGHSCFEDQGSIARAALKEEE